MENPGVVVSFLPTREDQFLESWDEQAVNIFFAREIDVDPGRERERGNRRKCRVLMNLLRAIFFLFLETAEEGGGSSLVLSLHV